MKPAPDGDTHADRHAAADRRRRSASPPPARSCSACCPASSCASPTSATSPAPSAADGSGRAPPTTSARPIATPAGRSRSRRFMELALYGDARLLHRPAAGGPAGAATSSRRRRSGRCSAPSSPASSTPSGSGSAARPVHGRRRRRRPGHARPRGARRRAGVRRRAALRRRRGRRRRSAARTPPASSRVPTLPDGPIDGVVLANELLDNLPFRLAVFDGGWREAFVADGADGRSPRCCRRRSTRCRPCCRPRPPHGARAPLQDAAAALGGRRPAAIVRRGPGRGRRLRRGRRRPSWRAARGASGCAPTAATSAAAHYLADPGDAGHHRRRRPRPAARSPTPCARQAAVPAALRASTSWSRRAGGRGRRRRRAPDLAALTMRSRVARGRGAARPGRARRLHRPRVGCRDRSTGAR